MLASNLRKALLGEKSALGDYRIKCFSRVRVSPGRWWPGGWGGGGGICGEIYTDSVTFYLVTRTDWSLGIFRHWEKGECIECLDRLKIVRLRSCFIRSLAVSLFSSSIFSFWRLFSHSAFYEENTSISPAGFFNNSSICFGYWTVFTFGQVDVDPAGLSFLAWLLLLISLYQLVSDRAFWKLLMKIDRKW